MMLLSDGEGEAAANIYAGMFADLSVASGFVLHGTLSSFYEDSAGTTAASASGTSPVGKITDVSGLENHAIQSTSGNKPLFYTSGGIKSFRSGTFVDATDRFLRQTTPAGTEAAFTLVYIGYVNPFPDQTPQNWGTALTNYDGGWGAGAYVRHGGKPSGPYYALADTGTTEIVNDSGVTSSAPRIVVIRRAGTGSNQTSIKVYDLAGTLIASGTGTQNGTQSDGLLIGGYNGVGADVMKFPFMMYAGGVDIGNDNAAAVVADLVSTFGAWGG